MNNIKLGNLVTEEKSETVMTVIGVATYINGQEMCMCQDGVIDKESFNFTKAKWQYKHKLHLLNEQKEE